ncbi:MAG: hypothetical protein IPG64_24635 [Haliea sp.]|nr:hypothetical protein [Haliea sp.]
MSSAPRRPVLEFFRGVFNRPASARPALPRSLVKTAIERAVDGTDPRVRIQSGYAKALRQPAMHAVEYVIALVDSFSPPIEASKKSLADDPAFAALVYSQERLDTIVDRDPALREFRAANPTCTDAVTALLLARKTQKHGFGHAQVGDQVLSDVPRTTISFDQHRLAEPAASEQETRRLLARRAFDHLLWVALMQITERKEQRDKLGKRKALLRSKVEILRRSGGFMHASEAPGQAQLHTQLADVDAQLSALGAVEDTLADNLAIVAAVLADAEHHLWCEDTVLYLDKLYVVHDKPGPSAPPTVFKEVHNSEGQALSVMLISIPSQ